MGSCDVEKSGCLRTSPHCWDRRGSLGLGRGAVGAGEGWGWIKENTRTHCRPTAAPEPNSAPVTQRLSSRPGSRWPSPLLFTSWLPGSPSFLPLPSFGQAHIPRYEIPMNLKITFAGRTLMSSGKALLGSIPIPTTYSVTSIPIPTTYFSSVTWIPFPTAFSL